MTDPLWDQGQAAIAARRALAADPTVVAEMAALETDTMRAIDNEGTCDGCSETKPLVLAVDVLATADSESSEPWLCQPCAALYRWQRVAGQAFAGDTDALAAVLDQHRSYEIRSAVDLSLQYVDCKVCLGTYPCTDARAALTALGVGEG